MFVIIVSAKRNVYCNVKLERELMRLQSSLPAAWPFQERRFRTPVLQWHRRQPFRSERDIQSLLNSPNLNKRHNYECRFNLRSAFCPISKENSIFFSASDYGIGPRVGGVGYWDFYPPYSMFLTAPLSLLLSCHFRC